MTFSEETPHDTADLPSCTNYTNAHAGRLTAHGDEQSLA
jgi:hypothetical protein